MSSVAFPTARCLILRVIPISIAVAAATVASPRADAVTFEGFKNISVYAEDGFKFTLIDCPPDCPSSLPFHVVAEESTGCGVKIDATVSGSGSTFTLDVDAMTCETDSGVKTYAYADFTLLFSAATFPLEFTVSVDSAWATDKSGQIRASVCGGEDGCSASASFLAFDGAVQTFTPRDSGVIEDGLEPIEVHFFVDVLSNFNPDAQHAKGTGRLATITFGPGDDPPCELAPDGRTYLGDCSELTITQPVAGAFLETGTQASVVWTGTPPPGVDMVDVYLNRGAGGGESALDRVPVGNGRLDFTVPEALSKHCTFRLYAITGATLLAESPEFTIRGWDLAKVDSAGEYRRFTVGVDDWSIVNTGEHIWPETWYTQFDYQSGDDPNTGKKYPSFIPFKVAKGERFPDWPLFTSVFGTEQCYWSTSFGFYKQRALDKWFGQLKPWKGSCSGFPVAAMLNFFHPQLFHDTYHLSDHDFFLYGATQLRSVINGFQVFETGQEYTLADSALDSRTPRETVESLRQQLLIDSPNIGALAAYNQGPGGGAHALVPYQLERDSADSNVYHIHVSDPNDANDSTRMVDVDVSANGGQGSWSFLFNQFTNERWSGTTGLYLAYPVMSYLPPPLPTLQPRTQTSRAATPPVTLATASGVLEVFTTCDGTTLLTTAQGDSLGFVDGQILSRLPGGSIIFPQTGQPGPPLGYRVDEGVYRVEMSGGTEPSRVLTVFSDSAIFQYISEPQSLTPAIDDDVLSLGPGFLGLRATGTPQGVQLQVTADSDADERTWIVDGLSVLAGDSLHLALDDRDRATLVNVGGTKTYDLDLRYGSSALGASFHTASIPLSANASHTITADWDEATLSTATILVDNDNDGSVDDTLHVNDETSARGAGGRPEATSETIRLLRSTGAGAPVRLRLSLAKEHTVTLIVCDARGRRVSSLLEDRRLSGSHDLIWDWRDAAGRAVAAGVYLLRIDARPLEGGAPLQETLRVVHMR